MYSLRRGLGNFSVADMIANCGGSGSQNCDPHDSSCVAVATALNDWAQNELEANFPYGPATMPACPDLSNTTAITQAFMNNTPVSLGPQTGPGTSTPFPYQTGTGPAIAAQYATGPNGQHIISAQATPTGTLYIWSDMTQSTTTQYTGTPYVPGAPTKAATPPPPPPPAVTPPATTPQGQTIINSSGANSSGSGGNMVAATSDNWFTDSMFGGIPNWGLLAAAGVAAVLVMGGHHGK
jgi:hypothetical protein